MRRTKSQPVAQGTIFELAEVAPTLLQRLPTGDFKGLYLNPIPSTRRGALFNAHSYPTKINVSAVMACILAHTKPGDMVFDGFAGSGVTGLAATLCGHPDAESQGLLESRLSNVTWGERDCVLYDLSELAAFIAGNLINPPDPAEFAGAAAALLDELENDLGWMYRAKNPDGSEGAIRHVLWTEHLRCPSCGDPTSFWDSAVQVSPAAIAEMATCSHCGHQFAAGSAERVLETYFDDLLDKERERRLRTPVYVYGVSATDRWKRLVTAEDLDVLKEVAGVPAPDSIPVVAMMKSDKHRWGHMHRSGYHHGVRNVHDFYTRRNLIVVAKAWELVDRHPKEVRDALRFWISSYNSTHSTLMTRVVCKRSTSEFVLSGAQPAALYIGGLPVEKNIILGLRRKLVTIKSAFKQMQSRQNHVEVHCGSSLRVNLPDSSVDYIFTDPPFGDNIQYSEVNFISEAWLGRFTEANDEVVINPAQGKSVGEYGNLLLAAFREAHRILKPGKFMTVAFHSTQPTVWEALRRGWKEAGFNLVTTSILDKEQTSFKQTTTQGAVQKDPLILLQKPIDARVIDLGLRAEPVDYWKPIEDRIKELEALPSLRTKRHLFSYLVTFCLEQGVPLPCSAEKFYNGLEAKFMCRDGAYGLP